MDNIYIWYLIIVILICYRSRDSTSDAGASSSTGFSPARASPSGASSSTGFSPGRSSPSGAQFTVSYTYEMSSIYINTKPQN